VMKIELQSNGLYVLTCVCGRQIASPWPSLLRRVWGIHIMKGDCGIIVTRSLDSLDSSGKGW
jgi:hypothetical protein